MLLHKSNPIACYQQALHVFRQLSLELVKLQSADLHDVFPSLQLGSVDGWLLVVVRITLNKNTLIISIDKRSTYNVKMKRNVICKIL